MKKNLFISVILLFLLGCDRSHESNKLKRIDFITAVRKEENHPPDLAEGEYLTFTFLNLYYVKDTATEDYTRSLSITIPVNDTTFTFGNDSTHLFRHLISDCGNLCPDIKIEEIEDAEITGKLIGKDKWQIEAKTKYFDFRKVVDSELKNLVKETVYFE